MKYRVIKSFPGNLNVGDLVYIEHPFIKYEKNGVDYKIGINEKDIEEFFVKENKRPISWEELEKVNGWCVDNDDCEVYKTRENRGQINKARMNVRPTKEMAEAQLALSQLMQLRDSRRDGREPDAKRWGKYIVLKDVCYDDSETYVKDIAMPALSFKDNETRDLFQETFSDLIDKIKPLYFS